jgi:zinc D-Ala-D-Ala dipeptidase
MHLLAVSLLFLLQAPQVFRIQPVHPVGELRQEAHRVQPPVEEGDFLAAELVEPAVLEPSIHLDVRYATPNNFLGEPVYQQGRAFLQRPAAEALIRAHRRLMSEGYGILIHDGYRPWWVTWVFWEATPDDKRMFVANPAKGSKHNRGCAADISMYDLKTGKAVEMPSLYDEMSERAFASYPGGTEAQRQLRELLRSAMEAEGFQVNPNEWWHFDYKDWQRYRIGNVDFEQLKTPATAR